MLFLLNFAFFSFSFLSLLAFFPRLFLPLFMGFLWASGVFFGLVLSLGLFFELSSASCSPFFGFFFLFLGLFLLPSSALSSSFLGFGILFGFFFGFSAGFFFFLGLFFC